ncbi:hypothetical protein AB0K15_30105 [Amycolatopsis sp. NPDC049253]|uniref:hypothetical protein n=1 Tax=Amycolatopsis sp. NPDC049253 TaxID=3155274 RepID=UPI00341D04AD
MNHVRCALFCTAVCARSWYRSSIAAGVDHLPQKYSHGEVVIGPPITTRNLGDAAATGRASA